MLINESENKKYIRAVSGLCAGLTQLLNFSFGKTHRLKGDVRFSCPRLAHQIKISCARLLLGKMSQTQPRLQHGHHEHDLLFHVFLRTDAASLLQCSQTCQLWRSVVRQAWTSRGLDIEELLDDFGTHDKALRVFSLLTNTTRPGRLKLSPSFFPIATFLLPLRTPFGDMLRELDMTHVDVSNTDLKAIPKRVFEGLRKLVIAPEQELISLLSLAPIAQNCRSLTHLRWQGFVVVKPAYLHRVLESNPNLQSLRIEAHRDGWRLQNSTLKAMTSGKSYSWESLALNFGFFKPEPFFLLLQMQGATLIHLDLMGVLVFESVELLSREIAKSCPRLQTLHLPLDCGWAGTEIAFSSLVDLVWVETTVFGRVFGSQLLQRATSDDLQNLSAIDSVLLDVVWIEACNLQFFETLYSAAALFVRLQSRTLQYLNPPLTIGMLEWLCSERGIVSHHFEYGSMNLVPVFKFESLAIDYESAI